MEAIIYTSNSGSTAKYAEMLSHELHLPTYNLKGAKQKYRLEQRLYIWDGLWQVRLRVIRKYPENITLRQKVLTKLSDGITDRNKKGDGEYEIVFWKYSDDYYNDYDSCTAWIYCGIYSV